MATDSASNVPKEQSVSSATLCNMESVNRISKLPVVETTIQTATNIYEKVKDYNSVTNWTLSTAENTVQKAIEVGKPLAAPVVGHLEGPIKKVDGMLCSGLDYVETKVPAVKLPPGELFFQMYTTTKDFVNSTVSPAVKTARDVVEPAVQTARQIAEPLVQPAVDKACALKDYGTQKVGELLYRTHDAETKALPESGENVDKKDQ